MSAAEVWVSWRADDSNAIWLRLLGEQLKRKQTRADSFENGTGRELKKLKMFSREADRLLRSQLFPMQRDDGMLSPDYRLGQDLSARRIILLKTSDAACVQHPYMYNMPQRSRLAQT